MPGTRWTIFPDALPITAWITSWFSSFSSEQVEYKGRRGFLYATTCGALLNLLQSLHFRDTALPKTPEALGRRLRSESFRSFHVLDESSAPELISLKRKGTTRKIGFFIEKEDDGRTGNDNRL